MPASIQPVNLLEQDDLSDSPVSKVIAWASTYGRYIMISTEVIVLLAFISRFSLDRKLTDLNESIEQKRVIIEANKPFEDEYLSVYNKLSSLNSIIDNQKVPYDTLLFLKNNLPADVYLENLAFSDSSINFEVVAGTVQGFATFINQVQTLPNAKDIQVGNISKDPIRGILFEIDISKKQEAQKTVKPETGKNGEKTDSDKNL